jgi:hypothetical protein
MMCGTRSRRSNCGTPAASWCCDHERRRHRGAGANLPCFTSRRFDRQPFGDRVGRGDARGYREVLIRKQPADHQTYRHPFTGRHPLRGQLPAARFYASRLGHNRRTRGVNHVLPHRRRCVSTTVVVGVGSTCPAMGCCHWCRFWGRARTAFLACRTTSNFSTRSRPPDWNRPRPSA